MQVCLLISEMTTPPPLKSKSNDRPHRRGNRARDAFRVTHPPFCRFSTYTLLRFFIGLCHRQPNYEVVARKDTHTNHWRPLDSRTRTTRSTRFDLKFFAYCQKIDTPELFIVLFFARKVSIVIVIEGG